MLRVFYQLNENLTHNAVGNLIKVFGNLYSFYLKIAGRIVEHTSSTQTKKKREVLNSQSQRVNKHLLKFAE